MYVQVKGQAKVEPEIESRYKVDFNFEYICKTWYLGLWFLWMVQGGESNWKPPCIKLEPQMITHFILGWAKNIDLLLPEDYKAYWLT